VYLLVSAGRLFLCASISFIFLIGCQSNPKIQFEKISEGMEKNEVLGLMGPPSASFRFSGRDRWIYRFYDRDQKFVKEVHFSEGKAVYVGEEFQAPLEFQAATVDLANEKRELELAEAEAKHRDSLKQSYKEYQQRSKLEDKVRYLPYFKPIR
jgi:outer membrane protein assembly factor BamE